MAAAGHDLVRSTGFARRLDGQGLADAVLSSRHSFRTGFGPVAVPEVGARPLFLFV